MNEEAGGRAGNNGRVWVVLKSNIAPEIPSETGRTYTGKEAAVTRESLHRLGFGVRLVIGIVTGHYGGAKWLVIEEVFGISSLFSQINQ